MNEIHLYGTVGDSFWDEDYFTPQSVRGMLEGREGPLTVRINSGGGIASDGQAIYTMLKDYPGEVEVVVDGVAASAASLIAMAGDKITMRLGSWMLIHDPATMYTGGRGTADDHRELAGFLDKIGDAYAQVYAARTGLSSEASREIMRAETVYLGAEAVEAGFANQFEGDTQAAVAADFDYRIYAHAPQSVREASERLGEVPGQLALAAIIAGKPRKRKEPPMANKVKASEAPIAEIQEPVAEVTAEEVTEAPVEPVVEAKAPREVTMTVAQVNTLHVVASQIGVKTADANRAIEEAASFDNALTKINAIWKEQGDVDIPMHGAPSMRILRDERDVQRAGMTEALTAQLTGADPASDKARPYMTQSLAEIAATCADYKGSMRTAGDKLNVFMAASHSTSDFPHIFENALHKVLLERYETEAPTYRALTRRRDFNDFRPHPMVRAGDFPKLQSIAEGGEIQFGTFGENRESAALSSYAIGATITRQMMVNDELGAIAEVLGDYGSMIADFEEETFYAFLASATLADGGLVYRANADRGTNLVTSGTAITVAALAKGRATIRKQTTLDGKKMNLTPSILLVSPDKETEAEQITTAIQPNVASEVNVFSGRLQVVTSAQLTGNAWYLFASPTRPGGACFIHGYLNGAAAPRIRTDEPFGKQGMSLTIEHDFGLGAIDYRGTFKNAGN